MAYPEIKPLDSDLQVLQHRLEQQWVKYALVNFVDIQGLCKGKVVPLHHFDQVS